MSVIKDYPYIFNAVAFDKISMEWMVVARLSQTLKVQLDMLFILRNFLTNAEVAMKILSLDPLCRV